MDGISVRSSSLTARLGILKSEERRGRKEYVAVDAASGRAHMGT